MNYVLTVTVVLLNRVLSFNINNEKLLLSVLEITVCHQTLSDQILKMSTQFHIMIRHND